MNSMQPYSDVPQTHQSTQSHIPSSGASLALPHYSHYSQPALLQPGPQAYTSQPSYSQYGYSNGISAPSAGLPATSGMGGAMLPHPIPAISAAGNAQLAGSPNFNSHSFDTSGQLAPPGMKPRVTATLWEDEGSLCFQVEAKGVCVARREDNHMINGTKLLNVAGMTRGRRDGILKSEKVRHVVKIGPMHLKGVWIPFERALDFANKEKITEQLYPLFVHDIGALLYHPLNQRSGVPGGAMAAADRRRAEANQQRYLTSPQTSQPQHLHHHHSMSNPLAPVSQPPPQITTHGGSARPGLDRAHTFPTPPTSANGLLMNGTTPSYDSWASAGMQGSQQLPMDNRLNNPQSVPATPATTPPELQPMQPYQTSQAYEPNRTLYGTVPASHPGPYSQPNALAKYPQAYQTAAYPKAEMAPPDRNGAAPPPANSKPAEASLGEQAAPVGQILGEVGSETENDTEYAPSSTTYASNRNSYGYSTNTGTAGLQPDELTGSPHQNGSGRATPRTTATLQNQWSSGYATPNRTQPSPSNLSYVMSDSRSTNANGSNPSDPYTGTHGNMGTGYATQAYSASNGVNSSGKRGRDDDEDQRYHSRIDSAGELEGGLKRRKTISEGGHDGVVGVAPFDATNTLQRARSTIQRRR